jgi:hypothetical protein
MMFWVREIVGWLLVGVGLVMFVTVYDFLQARQMVEGFILMIPGIFVFRGGIHLLKVAVAARISTQAQERLYPPVPGGAGPRPTTQRRG